MPEWLPVATAFTVVMALVGIGIWIGGVNADRKNFAEFVREIREDIKTILSRLPPPEATGSSPLQLTDFGKALSSGIDGTEWASRIADVVGDQVRGMEAYEIQEFSFAYVENRLKPSKREMKAMQRTAYEQGVRMKQIRRVLAIELRDKLLARMDWQAPD